MKVCDVRFSQLSNYQQNIKSQLNSITNYHYEFPIDFHLKSIHFQSRMSLRIQQRKMFEWHFTPPPESTPRRKEDVFIFETIERIVLIGSRVCVYMHLFYLLICRYPTYIMWYGCFGVSAASPFATIPIKTIR